MLDFHLLLVESSLRYFKRDDETGPGAFSVNNPSDSQSEDAKGRRDDTYGDID